MIGEQWSNDRMRPAALFVLGPDVFDDVYGEVEAEITGLVDLVGPPQTAESVAGFPELLRKTEVILGSWRLPVLDAGLLAGAPRLKAVFYAAGSVKAFVTDAVWERGIRVMTASDVNAIPVSEYAVATILFSLKHGWRLAREARELEAFPSRARIPGAYRSVVGVISLGAVGRLVCERLRAFDVEVLAHDPNVSEAAALGVELCSLEGLFERSDVVTCHAPLLDTTRGLITGAHMSAMRPGATFINTARGAVVREPEMIDVLRRRPDLQAVLDVTSPEPPAPGSPLYTLPNVTLTPHIAGSLGRERGRLGRAVVDDLRRYVSGQPLRWEVTRERALAMGVP